VEKESPHECKRCEMEDRVKGIMSRSVASQLAACQTAANDSVTHSIDDNDVNMSDSCVEAEAHHSQVILHQSSYGFVP